MCTRSMKSRLWVQKCAVPSLFVTLHVHKLTGKVVPHHSPYGSFAANPSAEGIISR